jgi:hypothetical protein
MLIGLVITSPALADDALSSSERSLNLLAEGSTLQSPGHSISEAEAVDWDSLISSSSGGADANADAVLEIGTNLEYLYWGGLDGPGGKDPALGLDTYLKSPNSDMAGDAKEDLVSLSGVASGIAENLNYIYERKTGSRVVKAPDPASGVDVDLDYLHKDASPSSSKSMLTSNQDASSEAGLSPNSAEQKDHTRDPYISSASNLNYLFEKAKATDGKDQGGSFPTIIASLNRLIQERCQVYTLPRLVLESSVDYSQLINFDQLKFVKDTPTVKNYAVVVGINKYSDRMGLHTCVNDADAVAGILKSYGYEVIKLTDETEDKPSKHNILKGALAEIDLTVDRGKVILYFSGHGEVDQAGNFYLIPQDANGAPSSYISEEDINQYTRDVKNLAIIIDEDFEKPFLSLTLYTINTII